MSHVTHMNESYHMWMRAISHECHASVQGSKAKQTSQNGPKDGSQPHFWSRPECNVEGIRPCVCVIERGRKRAKATAPATATLTAERASEREREREREREMTTIFTALRAKTVIWQVSAHVPFYVWKWACVHACVRASKLACERACERVCVCVCMRVCERACKQASVCVSERACEHACESPVDSRTNPKYCNIIQAISQFIIHIHVYKPRTGRTIAAFSVARGLTNQSPIPQHY